MQLPVANNAAPMPDVDREGSLIVSVTYDGSVYVGVNPISSAALTEKVRESLSSQPFTAANRRGPEVRLWEVSRHFPRAGFGGAWSSHFDDMPTSRSRGFGFRITGPSRTGMPTHCALMRYSVLNGGRESFEHAEASSPRTEP